MITIWQVPPHGGTVQARAINERGTVLGLVNPGEHFSNWYPWMHGAVVDPGMDASAGPILNDLDQLAAADYCSGFSRAVLWQHGASTPLPLPAGAQYSYPAAVNNRGQVAGTSHRDGTRPRPVLWDRGRTVWLPATGFDAVTVEHLSDGGTVAGAGLFSDGARNALLWHPTHGPSHRPPPQPAPHGTGPAPGAAPDPS